MYINNHSMLYEYAFHTLAPSVFSGFCEILLSLHLQTFTSTSDIQITSRCSSPKQHFFPPTFTIYNKFYPIACGDMLQCAIPYKYNSSHTHTHKFKFKKQLTTIMTFRATVTRKWEPLYCYTTEEKREF